MSWCSDELPTRSPAVQALSAAVSSVLMNSLYGDFICFALRPVRVKTWGKWSLMRRLRRGSRWSMCQIGSLLIWKLAWVTNLIMFEFFPPFVCSFDQSHSLFSFFQRCSPSRWMRATALLPGCLQRMLGFRALMDPTQSVRFLTRHHFCCSEKCLTVNVTGFASLLTWLVPLPCSKPGWTAATGTAGVLAQNSHQSHGRGGEWGEPR